MGPKKGTTKSTENSDQEAGPKLIDIDEKLNLILTKLGNIEVRLNLIESKQSDFEKSLNHVHQENEGIQLKQRDLSKSIVEIESKIGKLEGLESRIEAAEYAERAKCVELNGIPYDKSENLNLAYQKLLSSLKSDKLPTTIDKIYRIRQSKRIIIKFTQTNQRNEFFQQYRKNIQSLSALGFKETGRIYINEVLSRAQSTLFWKTRQFKVEYNYKYVWTSNQRIYLRKTPDSDAIPINSEDDLETLKLL